MLLSVLLAAALLLVAEATCTNIVLSNDDGWAEINIRTFHNSLTSSGHSVVLSAPSENQSGHGVLFETDSDMSKDADMISL